MPRFNGTGKIALWIEGWKTDGIYFVHAFKKKTQELPQKEIDVILKRFKGVITRKSNTSLS